MKKGIKLFMTGTFAAAAAGLFLYKKYQNSYERIADECFVYDENDFEPVVSVDDGFDYIMKDPEQIMFHE